MTMHGHSEARSKSLELRTTPRQSLCLLIKCSNEKSATAPFVHTTPYYTRMLSIGLRCAAIRRLRSVTQKKGYVYAYGVAYACTHNAMYMACYTTTKGLSAAATSAYCKLNTG